ncbi:cohesin domain-containing protein [Pseudoalteromonas luteoviolacea]|uniref:Uncharacterized protein n=1 Tax=Pseudoalteromonas luteoviolacea H33 TaxID=1365251 RepID=A0A166ZRS3_9GAMM|nr:cohesin domain-containing protein [Pseudoalteromonas luteoviolacea]KZN44592.1 hypothetical protein N476_06220 [Pseudoalteromonas luteoviolacea H33]KZN75394.1 hypothetical protein N477_19230 [Pseudoalteromonas luteoviolacea H33-S]
MKKIISVLLFFLANLAHANSTIYIDVRNSKIKTNSEFYVDIMAKDLPAVYGVHLSIKYDPTQLTVLAATSYNEKPHIEHGNLFKQQAIVELVNRAHTQQGLIEYSVEQAVPARNLSNTNRIARVFFRSKSNSTTTRVELEETYFKTNSGNKVPYSTQSSIDLQFANSFHKPIHPTDDFSFSRYLILVALAALFGLLTLRTRKTPLTPLHWLTRV